MRSSKNYSAWIVARPQKYLGSASPQGCQLFIGKWLRAVVAAFLWALTALALTASTAWAQGLPQTQILPDASGQGGRVRASIVIPAAPSIVWAVMMDCENAPRFVPNLRACAIESTSRDGSGDIRRHRIAWLAGFPPVTIRFASRYQAGKEIQFERISGDIAQMSGTWLLEPRNNGASTLLTYDAYLVPSRLLPSGLVRSALRRDTPKILEAVRQEAIARSSAPR